MNTVRAACYGQRGVIADKKLLLAREGYLAQLCGNLCAPRLPEMAVYNRRAFGHGAGGGNDVFMNVRVSHHHKRAKAALGAPLEADCACGAQDSAFIFHPVLIERAHDRS